MLVIQKLTINVLEFHFSYVWNVKFVYKLYGDVSVFLLVITQLLIYNSSTKLTASLSQSHLLGLSSLSFLARPLLLPFPSPLSLSCPLPQP